MAVASLPRFRDFDLYIDQGSAGVYPISVRSSPAGETSSPVTIAISFSDEPIAGWLRLLKARTIGRAELQVLGSRLTDCLLPVGPVRELYQRSLGIIEASHLWLRLRLHIASPELAALPWEYAYDDSIGDFLVLNPRTVLIRYLSEPISPRPVTSLAPVPILMVVSNPLEMMRIEAVKEVRSLVQALSRLLADKQVHLDVLFSGPDEERESVAALMAGQVGTRLLAAPASLDALREALRREHRIVHYVGHGWFDQNEGGALAMVDEEGRLALVMADTLARELRGTAVVTVILNACALAGEGTTAAFTGLAPNLIRAGIPAVVAMQNAIRDSSALSFSRTLYRVLADGWPLDAAVTEGRKAISAQEGEEGSDWGCPVLFMRSSDGVIWRSSAIGGETAAREQAQDNSKSADAQPAPPREMIFQEGGVVIETGARVSIRGDLAGRDMIVVKGKKKRSR